MKSTAKCTFIFFPFNTVSLPFLVSKISHLCLSFFLSLFLFSLFIQNKYELRSLNDHFLVQANIFFFLFFLLLLFYLSLSLILYFYIYVYDLFDNTIYTIFFSLSFIIHLSIKLLSLFNICEVISFTIFYYFFILHIQCVSRVILLNRKLINLLLQLFEMMASRA